ncbi:MAG: hypothetical protein R3B84_14575 [Zavarzinella sp.]
MHLISKTSITLLLSFLPCLPLVGAELIDDVPTLQKRLQSAKAGELLELGAGKFVIPGSISIPSGVQLKGAGIDQTILLPHPDWQPATTSLPDPEMKLQGLDRTAYLLQIADKGEKVQISHLTLQGPQVHGALFAWQPKGLHLHHVKIENTLWSGIRTFGMSQAKIHDCIFVNAGGKWSKGQPSTKGGITGGAFLLSGCLIRKFSTIDFYGQKRKKGTSTTASRCDKRNVVACITIRLK